ncbi:hypothetical protein [Streptomyces litchfieldiae]|uniref:Uncharacterized protein n=1 Tax=Streptomyces litchfieldiae TaxID=3075543 RepID=A0ABU2MXJ8_9ACTN|nr:hypothetical protein [Streptomyces sp. DSM 44938]MDT0346240.1 hypothetical protein [Streptomyces sp. DSM 44938]
MTVIGLDGGARTPREADHLLHRLAGLLPLPAGALGCTHQVRAPEPRLAVSLTLPDEGTARSVLDRLRGAGADAPSAVWGERWLPGAAGSRAGAEAAATAAASGTGRAVLFPGWDSLTGSLTLAELFDRTAISRAEVLGGTVPEASAVLDTRGHVRPERADGALLLRLMPVRGGGYVPFEIPDPHPCCGVH